MNYHEILVEAFDEKPLLIIDEYKFILNSLTEQVPATSAKLLKAAAKAFIEHMNIENYDKLLTEEDKGGILVAAVSLLTKLPFGMARWYPNTLADQVSSIFACEYITKGKLYISGIEPNDRVCIIDDLISTGGTLIGMIKALEKLGAKIQDIIVLGEKIEYHGVERVFKETGIRVKPILKISVAGNVSKVVNED